MLTQRRDPFAAFDGVRGEFDRLFAGAALGGAVRSAHRGTLPPLNAWETEDALIVEAELPGFSLGHLDITLLERDLTLKGTRESTDPDGARVHRRERGQGTFSRTLRLPFDVDADAIEASLVEGVLTITLPRAPELRPRRIEVRPATALEGDNTND
ncbi:MAG: Hsp20/alpha crystallin family protein [Planctomycetota bacterium]